MTGTEESFLELFHCLLLVWFRLSIVGRDAADVRGMEKQFVPSALIVSSGVLHCQGTSSLVIKQSKFWNSEGSLFPTIFSLTNFNRPSSSLPESLWWLINYCSGYHHIWSSITLLHLATILQRCFMEVKNAQVPLYKSTISENQVAPGDSELFSGRHRSAVNTRTSDLLCNKTLLCGWSGSKGFSVKNVGVYHVLCVRMMMRNWQRI